LAEHGWVDGRNLTLDKRYAGGQIDKIGPLAAAFVRAKVDLIVATSSVTALAAKAATQAIPIVMVDIRSAATHVDKILRGGKPGDIPVEQPTKFELVVNLKTAKALGLALPQAMRLRADQLIE